MNEQLLEQKVWLVAVNMGYGHQRTAYSLRSLAFNGKIINADDYQGIPKKDKKIWDNSEKFYTFISRCKDIPLVGKFIFSLYDNIQKIFSFYPKRNLSAPNFVLKQVFSLIKMGWGKDLIKKLKEKSLPLISTFYMPVFAADFFNFSGKIFCVICDADISRTWVSLKPEESKIKYFVPNERVVERLKLYGVREENIFLTGYPLPEENIGTENLEILKNDLSYRLLNLDPERRYCQEYGVLINKYLGDLPQKSNHPLTIMFTIGGAGAQKEIAIQAVQSLSKEIKEGNIKLVLSAGTRNNIKEYFKRSIQKLKLGKEVDIIFDEKIDRYFEKFNLALRKTDVLWTKPSELSFYVALGIPIIISPPIGSQEDFNKEWLLRMNSGIVQRNPKYTDQWFFDYLKRGMFAKAAFNGFIEAEKMGTFNIKKIISKCSG